MHSLPATADAASAPPPTVLFVDDEASVLDGLRRSLFSHGEQWKMLFAQSGRAALDLLGRHPVDVVVSDMRMPELDGATLLERVRVLQPAAARIILSGYSDGQSLRRILGPAHQYLQKPCSAATLTAAVSRALAVRALLHPGSILAEVSGVRGLPVLPESMAALMAEMESPNGSAHVAAQIIGADLGLSAQVLKLVNSGFFSLPQPVTDMLQAVRLLGFETLGALAVLGGLCHTFRHTSANASSLHRLAQRSLQIGELARRIAVHQNLSPMEVEQARCAGMLSHVGTLALYAVRPTRMAEIRRRLDSGGGDLIELEQSLLDTTHAHVGATLLGLWGFTDPIVEAVLFHHQPSMCTCNCGNRVSPLTAVHAAQHLVKPAAPGADEGATWRAGLDQEYVRRLGLEPLIPQWGTLARGLGG